MGRLVILPLQWPVLGAPQLVRCLGAVAHPTAPSYCPVDKVADMGWRNYGRGRPLNGPAVFIHPCEPIVAKRANLGVMLRRLIIALAATSALGISFCPTDALARRSRPAVADGVPSWDLTPSCRAAGSIGGSDATPDERKKICLATEQRTREELDKNWSTFPADDRIGCVKSLTFSPSYTELATCLEMRRDVRNLRGDAKPADTIPSQRK